METGRELRIVFILVFAIWFALTGAVAWMWVTRPLSSAPLPTWIQSYNLAVSLSRGAEGGAMFVLLIALYRHLRQPRIMPAWPGAGLAVALVGVLLTLVSYEPAGLAPDPWYLGAVTVSFFALPVFLFGLGLMFLLEVPPEPVPVFLPPQPAPPQPVGPGNDEVTAGRWGPP